MSDLKKIRTDVVGSLLRPASLKDARIEYDEGKIGVDDFRAVEDEAVRDAVRLQESIGLDVARFRVDRQSEEVRAKVMKEGEAGTARGVKNTPTIFVNGTEMRNGFTLDQLKETIDAALAAGKKS